MFHSSIEKVEFREESNDFMPLLQVESNPEERARVLAKLNQLAMKVSHNRKVKILKVWHGTSVEKAYKILQSGFSSLGKTDSGWFGKGIYFSSDAGYSTRYCPEQNACLIMCYVIVHNPYPIIKDDASSPSNLSFLGKANYKHYGCHYASVIPYGDDKTTSDYRPPDIGILESIYIIEIKSGCEGKYDEIVIFQEDHILPCFLVHVKKESSHSDVKTPLNEWSVSQVCEWMKTLNLSGDFTNIIEKEAIDGTVIQIMGRSEFSEIGIKAFGDWKKIETALNQLKNSNSIVERQIVE